MVSNPPVPRRWGQVSLLDFFWHRSYSSVGASERCRVARALLLAFGVAFYLGLKLCRDYLGFFGEENKDGNGELKKASSKKK